MRFHHLLLVVTACATIFLGVPPTLADSILDSVNPIANREVLAWNATSIGWFYSPTSSFTLNSVLTKFGTTDSRLVTEQVFDGDPGNGSNPLRSATFSPVKDVFVGGQFDSLQLDANKLYFIGFVNVDGLNTNVTADSTATALDGSGKKVEASKGLFRFGKANDSPYFRSESIFTSNPILEFQGNPSVAPLPSTVWLGATIFSAIGLFQIIRRIARPLPTQT